jgi:hypothetical protein
MSEGHEIRRRINMTRNLMPNTDQTGHAPPKQRYIFRLTFTHLATPVILQLCCCCPRKKVQWKCSFKLVNAFICAQRPYGIEPGYVLPIRMEFGGVSTPWTHPLNFHLRIHMVFFTTKMGSPMITDHFGTSPEELCMAA